MSVTLLTAQSIYDRVNDQRRDDGDGAVDDNKLQRALNATLDHIKARANWKFAIRMTIFEYLSGYPNYSTENILGLDDFKDINDMRIFGREDEKFDLIEADEFALLYGRGSGRNLTTVQWKDGSPIVRVNRLGTKPKAQLHSASEIATNGAWSADAATDAENLVVDDLEYVKNGAAIRFDIDYDQTGQNKATIKNSTLTAVDLTDYEDVGRIRMYVYIPAALLNYLSSFQLDWGSSSTVYWSDTALAPADGGSFVAGWNEIEFKWSEATNGSGSPSSSDAAAIDFLQFIVNYTSSLAADVTGVRINDIWAVMPERLELHYFSTFLVKTSAGTRQLNVTAATDQLIIPSQFKEVIVEGVLWQVMDQMGSTNGADAERHRLAFEYGPEYSPDKRWSARRGGLQEMVRQMGYNPVPEQRRFKIKMKRET